MTPTPDTYTLLAVTGLSPQVLTETVYALATGPRPLRPAAVHAVTTATGEAFLRAGLYGEPRLYRGAPIRDAAPRWADLSDRLAPILGAPLPEIEVHLAHRPGDTAPLDDVRNGADAELLANTIYALTRSLTRDGQPPLVASIAGGRKTMSADLQTAFSVYARPTDRLVHVLVSPASYERSSFYFPTEDTPDARLELVEVRTPRLYRLLDEHLLDGLSVGEGADADPDLSAILRALAPLNYREAPTRATVALAAGGGRTACRLTFFGADDDALGAVDLPAAETATLLAVAEEFARAEAEDDSTDGSADASADALLEDDVQFRRSCVMQLVTFDEAAPWTDRRAVSTAMNRLNSALEELPMAADALGIASERATRRGEPVRYRWAQPPGLALSVVGRPGDDADFLASVPWPFAHVPRPEPSDTQAGT